MKVKDGICDLVFLDSYKYNPNKSAVDKMILTNDDLSMVAKRYKPDVVAFESQFFKKNVRTLRSLCESVGAMKLSILLSLPYRVTIVEYSPSTIKKSCTGHGRATKKQVEKVICDIFSLEKLESDDQSDAVGSALSYIVDNDIQILKYRNMIGGVI